jgi:hypothetical protein
LAIFITGTYNLNNTKRREFQKIDDETKSRIQEDFRIGLKVPEIMKKHNVSKKYVHSVCRDIDRDEWTPLRKVLRRSQFDHKKLAKVCYCGLQTIKTAGLRPVSMPYVNSIIEQLVDGRIKITKEQGNSWNCVISSPEQDSFVYREKFLKDFNRIYKAAAND